MRIAAVVFDMDGVLIDAREWHYEALNRALALVGFEISRYEHLTSFDGLSTRQKLEMLSVERGLPRGLHSFLNSLKQRYTGELIETSCRPVFQHQYCLAKLHERGLRLAVASNAVRRSVDLMMERSDLARFLELTVSNEDVDRPKPAPDIYLETFRRLNLPASSVLVVEDNAHGIEAAQAAGAAVMAVANPLDVTLDRVAGSVARIEEARRVEEGVV